MAYSTSAPIGTMDADVLVTLNQGHRPTDDYVRELRSKLPREFPGVVFYFLPADIISQILNFGLPAPIDIQVSGPNVIANHAFATNLLGQLRSVPGAVDLRVHQFFDQPRIQIDVESHQGHRERIHAARRREQHADFVERKLSDHTRVLAGPEERRHL